MQKDRKNTIESGFSLVELMVSISVFSLILVVMMGSILSVFDANKKSQTLRAVMDNMNFSLESMTRDIRFGENYHCGSSGTVTSPLDCSSGDSTLNLKLADGSQVVYKLSGNRIVKTVNSVDYYVTSPTTEITIEDLKFRVYGSPPYSSSDLLQPQVIIMIKGYAGAKPTTRTSFILETTVSQRKLDL